jgi:hypothetical protein
MTNVIAERYKFYESKQIKGESLCDYIQKLRKKAEHCDFGDFLEDALRDKYVCGLKSNPIRQCLFAKKELTLASAIEISLSCEVAAAEENSVITKEFKTKNNFKINSRKNPTTDKRQSFRSNDNSHLSSLCRFKRAVCSQCHMKGHIARACRMRNKFSEKPGNQLHNNKSFLLIESGNKEQYPQNNILDKEQYPQNNSLDKEQYPQNNSLDKEQHPQNNSLDKEQYPQNNSLDKERCPQNNSLDKEQYPRNNSLDKEQHPQNDSLDKNDEIYHTHYADKISGKQPPYTIKLSLNKNLITFEIDTGSGITIISQETYNSHFSDIPLTPTTAVIKTYSKESLSILGKIKVDVTCNEKVYTNLRVFVLEGSGVNLLGRNWLNVIKLNWNLIINLGITSWIKNSTFINPSSENNESTERRKASRELTKLHEDFSGVLDQIRGYQAMHHARTTPFALEEALKMEFQLLRNKRKLRSSSLSERKGGIVVVSRPLRLH